MTAPARIALVAGAVLSLAGCQQQPPTKRAGGEKTWPVDAAAPPPAAVSPPSPPRPAVARDRSGLTPPELVPEAKKGEKGARDVLLSWARSIELGQSDRAWSLLSQGDKAKWSKARWRAMFAGLGPSTVSVPGGVMEGAAGSLYYTAPVTITANDRSGRPVRIEGEAILQRVNDVDGATPAQLRWHFERLTLDATH